MGGPAGAARSLSSKLVRRVGLLLFLIVAAAGLLAGGVAALGTGSATTVKVTLATKKKEFGLTPVPGKVAAGKITFVVSNFGALDHELVVLKTNVALDKLPVKNDKAIELGRVGKLPPLKPGMSSKKLTLTLAPGQYVLICNVAGHYAGGSRAAFRVG